MESKVEEAKRAAEQACAETMATAEKRAQGIQVNEHVFWLHGGNDAMLESGGKAIWPFDVLGEVVGKAETTLSVRVGNQTFRVQEDEVIRPQEVDTDRNTYGGPLTNWNNRASYMKTGTGFARGDIVRIKDGWTVGGETYYHCGTISKLEKDGEHPSRVWIQMRRPVNDTGELLPSSGGDATFQGRVLRDFSQADLNSNAPPTMAKFTIGQLNITPLLVIDIEWLPIFPLYAEVKDDPYMKKYKQRTICRLNDHPVGPTVDDMKKQLFEYAKNQDIFGMNNVLSMPTDILPDSDALVNSTEKLSDDGVEYDFSPLMFVLMVNSPPYVERTLVAIDYLLERGANIGNPSDAPGLKEDTFNTDNINDNRPVKYTVEYPTAMRLSLGAWWSQKYQDEESMFEQDILRISRKLVEFMVPLLGDAPYTESLNNFKQVKNWWVIDKVMNAGDKKSKYNIKLHNNEDLNAFLGVNTFSGISRGQQRNGGTEDLTFFSYPMLEALENAADFGHDDYSQKIAQIRACPLYRYILYRGNLMTKAQKFTYNYISGGGSAEEEEDNIPSHMSGGGEFADTLSHMSGASDLTDVQWSEVLSFAP